MIVQAENGQDLIDKLAMADIPQICMLDINMPVLNGYDTMSALKAMYPQMKFLVLTSIDNEYSITRMIRNGANGFLLKSCSPDDIVEALNSIHGSGYYYSDAVTSGIYEVAQQVNVSDLTEQEQCILRSLCSEHTYEQIAAQMHMSIHTVHDHKKNLSRKLKLKTRVGLALFAIQTGIASS